jgi:uncharacterized membrane protein YgaE (UPF0421/DUF939 family)
VGRERGRLSERLNLWSEHLSVERRHELLEAAAARSRATAAGRLSRLRASLWPIAQTAAAASIAWLIAAKVLDHPTPFFAPVAAILALGATRGQRARPAIEVMLGVALGVGVGDLLIHAIGTGVLQLALVIALAMSAAVLLKAGSVLLTEAAVSATLVATVSTTTVGIPPARLLDALVGGAVALLFSQVLFPVHPVHVVRDAAQEVLSELGATLDDIASALARRDRDAAESALVRGRRASDDWSRFEQALDLGRETTRFAPRRRRLRARMAALRDVAIPLDFLVTDVRVLARGAVRALMIDDPVPDRVPESLRQLGRAMYGVAGQLGDGAAEGDVGDAALRAVRTSNAAVEGAGGGANLSVGLLVAYTQATSADILRTLGIDRVRAHEMVGAAVTAPDADGAR